MSLAADAGLGRGALGGGLTSPGAPAFAEAPAGDEMSSDAAPSPGPGATAAAAATGELPSALARTDERVRAGAARLASGVSPGEAPLTPEPGAGTAMLGTSELPSAVARTKELVRAGAALLALFGLAAIGAASTQTPPDRLELVERLAPAERTRSFLTETNHEFSAATAPPEGAEDHARAAAVPSESGAPNAGASGVEAAGARPDAQGAEDAPSSGVLSTDAASERPASATRAAQGYRTLTSPLEQAEARGATSSVGAAARLAEGQATAGGSAEGDSGVRRGAMSAARGAAGPGVTSEGKVVLNAASAAELARLPGVGPKRAEAILALRQRLGRFTQLSTLRRVRGIGAATLKKLTPLLVLDAPAGEAERNGAPPGRPADKPAPSPGAGSADEAGRAMASRR